MISDDVIDEIAAALWSGEDVRAVEHQYGHVAGARLVVYLLSEGGGTLYNDAGLMERIGQF